MSPIEGRPAPAAPRLRPTPNPLCRQHLDEFVACYAPGNRDTRQDSERFKAFTYDELIAREIVEDLTAALAEFEAVATALESTSERDASSSGCEFTVGVCSFDGRSF